MNDAHNKCTSALVMLRVAEPTQFELFLLLPCSVSNVSPVTWQHWGMQPKKKWLAVALVLTACDVHQELKSKPSVKGSLWEEHENLFCLFTSFKTSSLKERTSVVLS
jgi:hypothetical protein